MMNGIVRWQRRQTVLSPDARKNRRVTIKKRRRRRRRRRWHADFMLYACVVR